MARVLHLVRGTRHDLTRATVECQLVAGDAVTVAVLDGEPPPLPASVTARRVGRDCTWAELLDLIFDSDRVITW
ncbi:MAG: hypothetical protein ACRELS_16750 [Candidatus Rokuibacteriota bacterium]